MILASMKEARLRIGQFRKFQQQLLQHMAVGGQVVAGQQRQGPRTLFAPAPRGRKDEAEDGTWPVRVFEIMDDIRVFAQQAAGGEIGQVALLCHGQGDDENARIGHPLHQPFGVFRGNDGFQNGADDAQALALAVSQAKV